MASASKTTASDQVAAEGFDGHYAELGDYTVGFESYTADADMTPLFVGLPNDTCQCEHWGYVFEGRIVYHTSEGDEEFAAGEAYFVGPDTRPRSSRARPSSSSVQQTSSTRRWRSSPGTWRRWASRRSDGRHS